MEKIKKEVIKSMLNFIKLQKYKKTGKINSLEEFDEYFELRLTRLNAIILLLIDYGFSNEHYSEEEINNFISLGRYAEIQITLYRDYSKSLKKADTILNSYRLFKGYLKDKIGIKEEKLIKEKYFMVKQKEINNLIENIQKINIGGVNGLTIKNKIDKRLQSYYSESNLNKTKL